MNMTTEKTQPVGLSKPCQPIRGNNGASIIEPRNPALHWIGGQWVNSDRHKDSINPATGEVIGT
jgi:hypothetical protein